MDASSWTSPSSTDGLLDKIVAQSDAQADGRDVRELERLRDDCLVSLMQGLRSHDYGAGAVLADYERALFAAGPGDARRPPTRRRCGCTRRSSRPSGSTTTATPTRAATSRCSATRRTPSCATSALDLGAGSSYFTVESHLSHLGQARAGDRLHSTTQVLGHDAKRLHVFHALYRSDDDALIATAEQMLLHVDTATDRASAADAALLERIERIARAHADLPRPERAGRAIGIPR